jgi:hypothetical protein
MKMYNPHKMRCMKFVVRVFNSLRFELLGFYVQGA